MPRMPILAPFLVLAIPFFLLPNAILAIETDVLCPDQQSRCPDGTTCCQLSGGEYGCCPLPNAVCCSDHLHCCPADTECDVPHQRCLDRTPSSDGIRRSRPFSRKFAPFRSDSPQSSASSALSERRHPQNADQPSNAADSPMEAALRLCGGGGATKTSVCPRDSKCCRHKDPFDGAKSDGCCPFPDGQCCAHSAHCCPPGFACDSVQAQCVNEQQNGVTLTTEQFETKKATKHLPSPSSLKTCPDGTVCASPSATCCPRQLDSSPSTLVFDCCPFSKANCCAGQFCCPEGHKCAAVGGVHRGCFKMSTREKIAKLFFSKK